MPVLEPRRWLGRVDGVKERRGCRDVSDDSRECFRFELALAAETDALAPEDDGVDPLVAQPALAIEPFLKVKSPLVFTKEHVLVAVHCPPCRTWHLFLMSQVPRDQQRLAGNGFDFQGMVVRLEAFLDLLELQKVLYLV